MDIARAIKQAREAKRISQEVLAKSLGVDKNTVWRWENNHAELKARDLQKIAIALKTSVSYLVGESDSTENYREITNIADDHSVLNMEGIITVPHVNLPNKTEETIIIEQGEGEKKIRLIFPQGTSGDVIAQVVSAALK